MRFSPQRRHEVDQEADRIAVIVFTNSWFGAAREADATATAR